MKVFISWSGSTSRRVAEVLRNWLPNVIQAADAYVSSEDIDKGARWSTDISKELEDSDYGIICVTPENINAPWLNFESGALSKSFETSRVSPFLIGVDRTSITGPLLQFQSTIFESDDVRKLVRSIHNACAASTLTADRVDQIFDVWWPGLEQSLRDIVSDLTPKTASTNGTSRSTGEILEEVLELVRSQQKIISRRFDQPEMERNSRIVPRGVVVDLERGFRMLLHYAEASRPALDDVDREEFVSLLIRLAQPIQFILDRHDLSSKPSIQHVLAQLA